MAEQSLKEFFRNKKAKAGGDIDWAARKDEWVQTIRDLYKTITDDYLAEPIADGSVAVAEDEKTIVEEFIGPYQAPELVLQVGDEKVMFSPKGRNIVGASGRIDLIGEMGVKTLVVQPERRWGVVESRTPTLRIVPLDKESLLSALKDVMRP